MRYYHIDATTLAKQLDSDVVNGTNQETVSSKPGFMTRFLRIFGSVAHLLYSKLYFVDVIVLICYAIVLIFSYLNKSWDLLQLALGAMGVTFVLYVLEGLFLQRYRSIYYDRLSESNQSVCVIRRGIKTEISPKDLMVGDLIVLKKGTILYADARIVSCDALFVDENLVFGATISTEKDAEILPDKNIPPEKQKNMVWKGSNITDGTGLAMVVALGSDCYIEKTGGRKTKKQRSFFYNKQNNIGHIAAYIYVILVAVGLLVAVIFTNRYTEAFLLMAVLTSIIFLNPVNFLMEWTYYRTAAKLFKQGVFVRNIEAFDGMNKEKEIYFDSVALIDQTLTYSHTVDFHGSEKSTLSYFALCMGKGYYADAVAQALKKYDLTFEKLDNNYPVFRRDIDHSGNVFSLFSNNGNSVAVSVGYWEKMLPMLKEIDDELLNQIKELETHGKFVFLMANSSMDFIPTKVDFEFFHNRMSVTALILFDIPVTEDTLSMIRQLRRSKMRINLINQFSETLGRTIGNSYDMDQVVAEYPSKHCYSLPGATAHCPVVYENASPIEKEQAMVVLASNSAPQKVIYDVKCMFCGIHRCFNFLSITGVLMILTTLALFLSGISLPKMVFPLLLLRPLSLYVCYYLIESARNCTQFHRSLVLGFFCGFVGLVAAFIGFEMSLFTLSLSVVLLAIYLLLTNLKFRKIRKIDVVILILSLTLTVFPWLFMGGEWTASFILALFPPIGAFLLDLFY